MQGPFVSTETETQQLSSSTVLASQWHSVLMVHSTKPQWLIFTQILYVIGVKMWNKKRL